MQFYNPEVIFKGGVKCDNAPTENSHLTRKQDISGLSFINGIADGSSSMLSVSGGKLSISNLALTDVHVDSSQTSLANFISNEGSTAASLQTGDVLILTAPSAGTETFMVSGANGSSASNYTEIESPLSAAEVGAVINAGDGISVNAANATISANIEAGTGLSKSVSGGQITFAVDANSDEISEGSSNLYYTDSRSRSAISLETVSSPDSNLMKYNSSTGEMKVLLSDITSEFTAGTGLSYSNGEYALDADSDDITEGSSNLYFTQARARGAVSGGTGLSYNSGTGAFAINLTGGTGIGISGSTISFNGDSDDVSEGSSNLYFSQARARASIQADSAAGNLLSYSNSSGDLLVSTASVRGAFSGGTAIGITDGTIAFNGSTSDVSEGSNQYFTQARARGAVSAESVSSPDANLLQYNSSTGAFKVLLSDVVGEFTAGTGLAYDGTGEYSLDADTDDVAEGSSNLYHTAARVRAAVSVSSQADELIGYDSSNGSFSLRLQELRHEQSVTLSANTAATITHNLGKQLVHVSAMDASGNKIELDVVYTNTNALTVESAVGVTVTVAVSV
tara:strand:+ start:3336 stop:5033 length:1698 start_codon:yes stop_codon:yes gene_type:complete